VGQNIVNNHLP